VFGKELPQSVIDRGGVLKRVGDVGIEKD